MKLYSLIALFATAAVAKDTTDIEVDAEAKLRQQLNGAKSFYDGYYKSFYHVNSKDETLTNCMDEKTIDNMIQLGKIIKNPLSMFEMKNIKADMNMFGEAAEVTADLSECHFEQSFFDIWAMCQEDKEVCAMPKLTENLTKNMFVIVGKLTQMGETMTELKTAEGAEYNELMKEIGSDWGTMIRDFFAFTGPAPKK